LKRKIISLALTFAMVFAFVQTVTPMAVAVPPAGSIIQDPSFYAAVLEIIGESDGYVIAPADVASVTMLNIGWKSIQSLEGIEYFISLERLWCHNNQLTSLDVSNNTALTSLYCFGNQLTSLDVSNNTALTDLLCGNIYDSNLDLALGGNHLTTLDLSNNTALTILDCTNNHLTTLDLSNNTALEDLRCGGNKLTTLDLSNNTALWNLECGYPRTTTWNEMDNIGSWDESADNYSFGNLLTTLDLSNNIELGFLDCSGNQLTTLDVSNNTKLHWLQVDNNQLLTLDVSNNTALWLFDCRNNKLTTLDVSNNTGLSILAVGCNHLTTLDLSNNTILDMLNAGANQFPNREAIIGLDESKTWAFISPLGAPVEMIYNANGATNGSVPIDYVKYEYNEMAVVLGNIGTPSSLSRSGYTFGGWALNSAGTGTVYQAGNEIRMKGSDITLYAIWAANGGSGTSGSETSPGSNSPTTNGGDASYDDGILINGQKTSLSLNEDGSVSISAEEFSSFTTSPIILTLPIEGLGNSFVVVQKNNGDDTIIPFSVSCSAIITEPGTYAVIDNKKTFTDVNGHWAAETIDFITAREIFNGIGSNLFDPNGGMTRAMFAQVLANLERVDLTAYVSSSFTDIEDAKWYMSAVEWAAEKGIVGGYGGGLFGPNDLITREQMAVMLNNYLIYKNIILPKESNYESFADDDAVSSWARDAVANMKQYGLISGIGDNMYAPGGTATRASVAQILRNFIEAYIG